LVEESTRLEPVDEDFVWRVKGSHVLSRPGLAVLRDVWRWREREAVAANKPPFFILSHEVMVKIAGAAVGHQDVESLLPRHLSERRRAGLCEAVWEGLAVPLHKHPEYPRRNSHRPTEAERLRYATLEKRRDARATELDIDPTLIASRSTLNALAHNWEQNLSELMNWQRVLLEE
jgi:ribonuclease D